MIDSKIIRYIVGSLILCYVTYGILENFSGPSKEEFYNDLMEHSTSVDGHFYSSMAFNSINNQVNPDSLPIFINCIKTASRTMANLGENEKDKFVFLQLTSKSYSYKFAIKWRKSEKVAYVTGIENREGLDTGISESPSGIGKIGGTCLHNFLNENF